MSKTVFLGDSLTARFTKLNELPDVVNMGIGGDKTIEIIGRIKSVYNERPDKLFLMVGINDFLVTKRIWPHEPIYDFQKTFDVILDTLKSSLPDTKFYILAILPITACMIVKESDKLLYNKEIDGWNQFIKEKTKEYEMEFLDLTRNFKDKDNCLKNELSLDGIHINDMGYVVYYQLIKDLLTEE